MDRLTAKQAAILDMMVQHFKENFRFPTTREVCAHFKVASTNGAYTQLRALVKKGFLNGGQKPRGFTPTNKTVELYNLKNKPPFSDSLYDEMQFAIVRRKTGKGAIQIRVSAFDACGNVLGHEIIFSMENVEKSLIRLAEKFKIRSKRT